VLARPLKPPLVAEGRVSRPMMKYLGLGPDQIEQHRRILILAALFFAALC